MYDLSALEIRDLFIEGKASASEITGEFLQRIERYEQETRAFLEVFSEDAKKQAKKLDERRAEGKPLGLLAGVPIAVKDNIHVSGKKTTCASKILSNYTAVFSASIIEELLKEGAILIGKTNLDEFAMGSSTENSAFTISANPWDTNCVPGGSSGGSASAVAARLCKVGLGSDTGGSIRQPAALTGIVGFKPTYGRVSRYGLVAFASSLDQIGPMTTTVADAAAVMDVIGRPCKKDSTCFRTPAPSFLQALQTPVEPLRIGVPFQFLENLEPSMRRHFDTSIAVLRELGHEIVEVDLSLLKYSVAVYYILATAEASTNLARYDGIRYGHRSPKASDLEEIYEYSKGEGFGVEVKNRILIGTYVLSSGYKDAYYKKAQQVRTLIIRQLKEAFRSCRLIAMPSSPIPAFPPGAIKDPLQMYLQDIYTIGANLSGMPAISVPSGFTEEGKPIGLQLVGDVQDDATVLRAAAQWESRMPFGRKIPPLFDKG